MPKRAWIVLLLGLGGACTGSSSEPASVDVPPGATIAKSALARATEPNQTNVAALGADNRAFAFELYQQIAKSSPGQNVILSPYSVSTALAMAYAGARTRTAQEMQTTLHFGLPQSELHEAFDALALELQERGGGADATAFRLNVDDAIWAPRNLALVPAFLDTLALNYGAGVFLVDFGKPESARAAINGWVADKTDKLIPTLLPEGSIEAVTRLVLTNTVYFNAGWQQKFDPADTHEGAFTKLDGSRVSASLMHNGLELPYAAGEGYQAVALPYADDKLSFIAVLPDDGAYERIEASMTGAWLDTLRAQLSGAGVVLAFPKLDYSTHISLKPQLQALGMHAAFAGDADFSGISEQGLAVSDVIHQAVLKVFEDGTVAAAATAVVFRDGSAVFPEHTVTFDRPFFFAIVDEPTGALLFIGRVLDPS